MKLFITTRLLPLFTLVLSLNAVTASEQCGTKWCNDPFPNCCNPTCGTCVSAPDPNYCDQNTPCDQQPSFTFPGCFPETATVQVMDKDGILERTAMADLKVGQVVLVGYDVDDTTPLFEPVYGFGHIERTEMKEFIRLSVSSGHGVRFFESLNRTTAAVSSSLEMTGDHMIFLKGVRDAVRADAIKFGDIVLFQSPPQEVRVIGIETVKRKGLYQPLTRSGRVVVDDIMVSSYVSISTLAPRLVGGIRSVISEQTLFHWWMAPYRTMCTHKLIDCDNGQKEGIIPWLEWGRKLAEFGEQLPPIFLYPALFFMSCLLTFWAVVLNHNVSAVSAMPLIACIMIAGAAAVAQGDTRSKTYRITTTPAAHTKAE